MGKISILGDDGVGHCERKLDMNICLVVNGYLEAAVSIFSTPLEFCLWGWITNEVYKRKVVARHELLDRMLVAAVCIKKCEDQLRRRTRDLCTRVAKCTEVDGGILEHLLCTVRNLSLPCNKFVI